MEIFALKERPRTCPQSHGGRHNDTSKAKATKSGVKKIRIVTRVTRNDITVRSHQRERLNMMAEWSLRRVILTVHIVRNGTTYSNGSTAGKDGGKPTLSVRPGQQNLSKLPRRQARFGNYEALRFIRAQNLRHSARLDQSAAII
jgi:hypothetical protein